MENIKIFLTLLFAIVFKAFAQEVYVNSGFEKSEYFIGDRIIFSVELKSNVEVENFSAEFPDTSKSFETLDISKSSQKDKEGYVYRIDYVLTKFDSGRIVIPEFIVKYYKKGDTNPRILKAHGDETLVTYAPISSEDELKDIKPPIKIPLDWKTIIIIILIITLAVAAGYYWFRKYYMRKSAYKTIVKRIVPPGEKALTALKELDEKKLWQRGMVKEYHSEITEIIRLYFEERFGFPALKLTTGEALEFLRAQNLEKEMIEAAENFLNAADLVKFAKFNPDPDLNENIMKFAVEFVEKTKMDVAQEVREVVKAEETNNIAEKSNQ